MELVRNAVSSPATRPPEIVTAPMNSQMFPIGTAGARSPDVVDALLSVDLSARAASGKPFVVGWAGGIGGLPECICCGGVCVVRVAGGAPWATGGGCGALCTGVPHLPQKRDVGALGVPQVTQKLMTPSRQGSQTWGTGRLGDWACDHHVGNESRVVDARTRVVQT